MTLGLFLLCMFLKFSCFWFLGSLWFGGDLFSVSYEFVDLLSDSLFCFLFKKSDFFFLFEPYILVVTCENEGFLVFFSFNL